MAPLSRHVRHFCNTVSTVKLGYDEMLKRKEIPND